MKKKKLLVILGLSFMLFACGESTKVIEGEVKTIADQNLAAETQETESQEQISSDETLNDDKGYIFIHNNVIVEINSEASEIIEQLGEAKSYFEAPSCAFGGIYKIYAYNSFEVDTYPLKGIDYVFSVNFQDDVITTAEGVGIGDSATKVTEIYGEGIEENGMLVYEKDGMKLCFVIQEDLVASVKYSSTILEE